MRERKRRIGKEKGKRERENEEKKDLSCLQRQFHKILLLVLRGEAIL